MIRFVDFDRQLGPDGPRMFGFWATGGGPFYFGRCFVVVNGHECWSRWEDFARDHQIEREECGPFESAPTADDFRPLCPPWAFGGSRTGEG
jgi:hypothetical protein